MPPLRALPGGAGEIERRPRIVSGGGFLRSQMLRRAVLQRFGQMLHLDLLRPIQVGDGPGHPQNPVVPPGRQPQPVIGPPDELLAGLVQLAAFTRARMASDGSAGGDAPDSSS